MKIILLLVYLWRGQITIEQKPFDTDEACMKAGAARAAEIVADPRFGEGLYAGCVPVPMQSAEVQ